MATTKSQTEADKAAKEAAERKAAIDKADADFKAAVVKAAEAREKVLEKYPDLGNVAEAAWNETKVEEDPPYKDVTLDKRQKLDSVVDTIKTTGNADVVGLEDFEARVIELLKERKLPVAGVVEKDEKEKGAKSTTSTPSVERAREEDEKRFAKARKEEAAARQTEAKRQVELKRQAEAKAKAEAKLHKK